MKTCKKLFFSTAVLLFAMIGCNTENEPGDNPFATGTVKDADGNQYKTIKIGTQVWMAENLKTTKYNDGTAIHTITGDEAWESFTTGAYCWYDNDEGTYKNKYGALYNWYAVNTGKLAPKGWHVPTDDEWTILEDYVSTHTGASGSVAKALAAKTGWAASTYTGTPGNDPATNNSSGFTALPGGYRYGSGFGDAGINGYWWSSAANAPGYVWSRYLHFYDDYLGQLINNKYYGFYVRCVRD